MSRKRQITARRKQGGKGKPFVKGDSRANKDGRPPLTPTEKEVKELARQKSIDCITRLDLIAKGKGMTAVRANEIILDRAWGKPKQEVELPPGTTAGLMIMVPPENPDG